MRRLLAACTPALFSLCFILILLALLAAGAAAAHPISSAAYDRQEPDRATAARPVIVRPPIAREPAPADTQLAAPVAPSAGSGDEARLAIAEARLVASDVDAPVATLEIQVNYANDWVAGVANSYATVVVTVTNGVGYLKEDAVVVASESGDFFVSCDDWYSGQCPDIVPGDIVKVWATDLLNLINPVGSITGVLDESQNTVAGVLNANWFGEDSLFVNCEIWEEGGPPIITLEGIPTDGGTFTCDFDDVGWDLQRGHTVVLRYYEPDGDQVINIVPWPWMRVNYGHDWVGGNYAAGHTFTITVTDDLGNPKATAVVDSVASGSGWGSESFQTDQEWQPAQPDIQPYDIVQIKTEGYSSTIQVGDIGTDLDIAADQVGGNINAPWLPTTLNVECHPWGAWGSGNPWAPVKYSTAQPDNSSPYNCAWDPLTEWDIQLGQDVAVIYNEPDEDMVINVAVDPLEIRRVELWLRPGGDSNLWGEAYPGLVVTVTSPFGSHYNAWADPDCGGCWSIDNIGPLIPGDNIVVEAGAATQPVVVTTPSIDVALDTLNDDVSGQIVPWSFRAVEVYGDWPDGYRRVYSDINGNFLASYPDIPRGAGGYLRFEKEIDLAQVVFHRPFWAADLVLNVNYGHDWIEGNYEPGHTVWITVTAADGVSIKGTAELWSGEVPWWGGNTGFSTNWHGWTSPPPDIAPGDRVFGKVDNGYTTTVRIFTIEGEVDVGADTAVGTITAPWLVGEVDSLYVQCQPWSNWDDGGNAPLKESIAPPNGSAPFLCQWDPLTEYDVEYFQDIGIWVLDPSGNAVLNALQGQGIDLMVDKWRSYLDDPTAPGGVIVYGIYYQNNGNIPAEDVQIVDVLPDLTGYAGDTSRLPYTVGPGNVITWQVGTLDPGQYALFRLTLNVSPDAPLGAGVIEPNCLTLSSDTSPEANPGNEELCAPAVNVAEGEIDVSVSKWAWPGDPAPGQNFYYTIEWCNNRPLDAGPAIMTDTLPAGTALVEWRETEWWRNYWLQESFDGHELAFFAPGLAGNVCGQIELTLALDPGATIGANLVNQVVLDVAGDVNPDDNTAVDDSAYVSPPRYDLVVDKRFNNGRLYPGGWINYFIDYRNNGNIDTPVTITETVPAGLIFDSAWWNGGQEGENQPLPMPEVVGDLLVWHLDTLPHGNSRWFHVQFYIDPDVPPGTEFGNCVTIAGAAADAWPDDNDSCQTVTVNPPGPNLRVTKRHWWPNSEQIAYEITFYNTGTDSFYDVVMTDTLPSGVTAGYWPENDYYAPIDMLNHTADGYWWFSISEIQPGDAGHIWFDVTLDDPTLIPAWYTNIVTISTPPGDVNPSDNSYADLAGLLPDTVMRISPPEAQIPPDATITLDVTIDEVIDLYGLSVEISFDPAVLQVVDADPGKAGVQIEAGSCPLPDFVLANVADNSAGLINYDVSSLLPSPPCTGSGLAARITFRAVASGASPVHFAGWLLANSEAQVIELRTEDGQVIVSDLGLIQGKVELQGRTNHGGAEVCASDGAMVTCAISDAAGDYALWLPGGVYTVTAEIMSYLDGEKGGVTAGDGGGVTLAKVKLLGGDTNNDCTVNILDLSFMGARYSFALGDPGYDVRADINVDNVINILDIVLGGSNYRKSCPVAWP